MSSSHPSFNSNSAWIEHLRDHLREEECVDAHHPSMAKAAKPLPCSSQATKAPLPSAPKLTTSPSWVSTQPSATEESLPFKGRLQVIKGKTELAICQTKGYGNGKDDDSTWVGEIDAAYLPHGIGVMFLSNPDGTVTKRVEKRTHGTVDGTQSWNQVVPPPRKVRQCTDSLSSAPEEEDDDLNPDLLPYGYYEDEPSGY